MDEKVEPETFYEVSTLLKGKKIKSLLDSAKNMLSGLNCHQIEFLNFQQKVKLNI